MSDSPAFEPSRRSVFRGGAIGAGALIGALGLGAGAAAASEPAVAAPDGIEPAALPTPEAAAVATTDRVFLKLDGIAGDSTLKGLENWIELTDFSWGAQNPGSAAAGGGGGAGKATALDVSFAAPTSKATPLLLGSLVTGKHIKTGKVVVTKSSGAAQVQFLKVDLTDVTIDFLKIDTPSAGLPTDKGSLTFSKIKFAYYPQSADGKLGTPVSVEWDLKASKIA